MIVEDVRIKTKETTIGNQHDESFITYYDIQVKVFDNWWSLVKDPKKCMDLDKAIFSRDKLIQVLRGTS